VCNIDLLSWTPTVFEAYDIILSFWDVKGNRVLYGYQLKEGKTTLTIPQFSDPRCSYAAKRERETLALSE
jgi:hypothetical protein